MTTRGGYTILPTTWKARLLLALAFLGGSAIVLAGASASLFDTADVLPDAPCYGSHRAACLEAQTELEPVSRESCEGTGRRICLVPIGKVSAALVRHLAGYYLDQYGLNVTVLTPAAVPGDLPNSRGDQIDSDALIEYMGTLFPEEYDEREVVLVGITPLDLYKSDREWRFAFGARGAYEAPQGVISTFRMNPETFGERPADERFFARVRKLLSKYIGLLYYDLAPSQDPNSPLYDSILGVSDLDRMREPLPVAGAR